MTAAADTAAWPPAPTVDPWAHAAQTPDPDAAAALLGGIPEEARGWRVVGCAERDAAHAAAGGLEQLRIVASDTIPDRLAITAWGEGRDTWRVVDLVAVTACAHMVPDL